MKKILSVFGISSIILGVMPITNQMKTNALQTEQNNYLMNKNDSRVDVTNLSRIRVKEFNTDLSVLENKPVVREDYLEEIKWGMIDSNMEQEDLLFDIWDSVIYDEPDKWQISGLDWSIPETGNEINIRVKLKPEDIPVYSGNLTFKTKLMNTTKNFVDISNLIKNTSLGTITDNEISTIKSKIEQKNEGSSIVWNQIRFANISENSVTIFALEQSTLYKGAVSIDYKIGINLVDAIKNYNIGKIINTVTEDVIINEIRKINSNLQVQQLVVKEMDLKLGTALIKPRDDLGDYVGERLVTFVDSKHLNTVIDNTNLGSFVNPNTYDLINKIVELNNGLSKSDFTIVTSSLSYSSLTIKASAMLRFHGEVKMNFLGTVNTSISYDSGLRSVSVYGSTKKDAVTDTISFTPGLGKSAFLKKYKYINLDTLLYSWMNDDPHVGSMIINKKLNYYKNLSSTNVAFDFYKTKYSNVNWMTSHSTYKFYWSGDTLKIEIWTKAEAFASGWNVYWAEAKSQTRINSVWFD